MTKEEARDAMQQYADTGRVTHGPAAPGGDARQLSEREKREFDGKIVNVFFDTCWIE